MKSRWLLVESVKNLLEILRMWKNSYTFALAIWERGVAQSGSAPGLGPGGRRFESCRPDIFHNDMASSLLGG